MPLVAFGVLHWFATGIDTRIIVPTEHFVAVSIACVVAMLLAVVLGYAAVRTREEKDQKAKVFDLYVDVEEGPRYEVSFTGNEAIPDWELKKRLTFWESRSVTEQDAARSAAELRRAYQQEGYAFAEVEARFDPKKPTRVDFVVREGPKAEIQSIHIQGNRAFHADDAVLKKLLASGESGMFKARRLLPEQLDADAGRLQAFYQDHGYLRIQVLPPLVYFDPRRTLMYRPPAGPAGGGGDGGIVHQHPAGTSDRGPGCPPGRMARGAAGRTDCRPAVPAHSAGKNTRLVGHTVRSAFF
jgi:hypothetical protein